MQRIVIIGAGLVGAALAFRLAEAGAEVTVLEAGMQPAAEASGRSFGWINASFFLNEAHHHLRVAGMAAHRRMARDLMGGGMAGLWHWSGCLWWEDEDAAFEGQAQDLARLGYPLREVTGSEVAALEPALAAAPRRALFLPQEGAVDAAALTRALLQAAADRGAALWFGMGATGVLMRGGAVCGVRMGAASLAADQVIVAAGTAAPALLEPLGYPLPMLPRPGLILRTRPVAPLLRHILAMPGQDLRQDAAGRLIAPLAAHHQADRGETAPQDPAALVAAAIARLEALFAGVALRPDATALAWRPVPGDGLPAVGPLGPGLWAAVMHSGVTLAAIVAEALTAAVLERGAEPMLAPFDPARFRI
ncbi:FAD-dependent oxidoreductase [bacterium]|nr:FAD-dependent oxidoreductase [bacterium]